MKGNATIFTVIMTLVIAVVSMVNATQIINYQGHLTDSSGDPVADGDYQITFTIYDGGGVSHWSSGPLDIPVTNGMFSHNLGSVVSIPDDVFEIAGLYLGIQVGSDPEISPKTLLTSAPKAAVAQNMTGGSIETDDGIMVIKASDGDTAMIFTGDADYHGIRVHPPDPCVPLEPCAPAVEISANNENRIDLYYPGAEADAGIVQLIADPTEGGYVEIHAAEPLLGKRIKIGGSVTDTGFVTLYGGDHGAEFKLLEMTSLASSGQVSFFDSDPTDGREMMTLKSSPTEGTSIVGFNPQPEPPGIPAFKLGFNGGGKGSGSYLRLFNSAADYLGEPLISIASSPGEGGRISIYDGIPPDDNRELLAIGSSPTDPVKIVGFNPQPEPPGTVAFELGLNTSVKGDGGGMMTVYDSDSVNTSLSGGTLRVGHRTITDYPSGTFAVNGSTCELTMTGEGAPGSSAMISMVARSDSAKVGIGTNTPGEALHVIGNIALTGEIVYLTDTKLKTNIRSIDNAIEIVRNINGVRYNYRYDEYPEMKLSEENQIGLLAQDIEKVLPELVHEDAEGIKYVAYTKLTAVLIEAVKELKTENEELKKRIEALEN